MLGRKSNKGIDRFRAFDRAMLRSAFRSLFWGVITARKEREGYELQQLAKDIEVDKSLPSRWFAEDPNWQLNSIADIAWALDLDIIIEARERSTGIFYTPSGPKETSGTSSTGDGFKILRNEPNTSTNKPDFRVMKAAA